MRSRIPPTRTFVSCLRIRTSRRNAVTGRTNSIANAAPRITACWFGRRRANGKRISTSSYRA
jgi:hypothetical protein